MEPSLSSTNRFTEAKKSLFITQAIHHELFMTRPHVHFSPNPKLPAFVFAQTYSTTMLPEGRSALSTEKKKQLPSTQPPTSLPTGRSGAFSSFSWVSSFEPKAYLALREQRKYGGPISADIDVKGIFSRSHNLVAVKALALPTLSGDDPTLVALLEPAESLAARQVKSRDELLQVNRALELLKLSRAV
jgi:hypothetical protein